jgi:hypothetical protein
MLILVRCACLIAVAMTLGSCASSSRPNRPRVYRGGLYYGDAVHSRDLKNQ